MTDIKDIKTSAIDFSEKVKAIYPHITVTGDVDKPYYNIDWYDIEKKTMYRGYSSYKLELVRKWLQEEFEVVEEDIDDLINRQKAEIEEYQKHIDNDIIYVNRVKAEAYKEFAEKLKGKIDLSVFGSRGYAISINDIDNLVKEMVGENL